MKSDEKSEIDYHLTTPVSYSHGGEKAEAQFIRLTAPTSRHSRECAALKQAFFRSCPQDREANPDAEIGEVAGHDVIVTIASSRDVSLPDVIDVARKLFTSGVAMVDGEVKLTQHLIDAMSQDDLEGMVGDYMVGFTLASSLEKMRERSSPGSRT